MLRHSFFFFLRRKLTTISEELCEISWLILANASVIKGIAKLTSSVRETSIVKGDQMKDQHPHKLRLVARVLIIRGWLLSEKYI